MYACVWVRVYECVEQIGARRIGCILVYVDAYHYLMCWWKVSEEEWTYGEKKEKNSCYCNKQQGLLNLFPTWHGFNKIYATNNDASPKQKCELTGPKKWSVVNDESITPTEQRPKTKE